MPVVSEKLPVPHRPENLFELVSDIRKYPAFIPWIKLMRVSRERNEGEVRRCRGEALVGFKGFREQFATDVIADKSALTVETSLVRGPFRRLSNAWRFTPQLGGATEVHFTIDYEFSNFVLQALLASNMESSVSKVIRAFTDEADRRYERA